jgi:hypothetical protein
LNRRAVNGRFVRGAKDTAGFRIIPNDAERHGMCYHAERGNNQKRNARCGF